jgi:hypothetical protein
MRVSFIVEGPKPGNALMNSGRYAWLSSIVLIACVGCGPIVEKSQRVASPDGTFDAVVERLDTGVGFGQDVAWDEVHVVPRNATVREHQRDSHSVVFVIWETEVNAPRLAASWVGPRHLVITYDSRVDLEYAVCRFDEVSVDYSPPVGPPEEPGSRK